jgi:phosphate/phosphite/phosphonate ABC transporter binding protein
MQRKLGFALVLFFFVSGAHAQWQKKYPVVKYGVIPVETQTGTTKTMDGFLKHAEKTTGVKWELYQATDYSGVMNALIAGQINLAWLSGFSYCQTFADSKGGVEPLVAAAAVDGSMGYNAVVVVRADSPYKTIDDLKGKVVARTDPLSGSGYLIPTAAFRAMGKPVDEYYKSPLSGGHVQSGVHLDLERRRLRQHPPDDEPGSAQARRHPHHLDLRPAALAAGGDPQGCAGRHARRHAQALHRAAQDGHGARRVGGAGQDHRDHARQPQGLHADVPGGRGRARSAAQAS